MEHLEQTLRDILAASKLSLKDVTDREQIMQKLRGVVAQSLYLRGASVVPYGSFASQLSTRWGDLDISMDLDIPNSNAANALRYLGTLLNEKDEWQNVVYIPSTRFPILKFDHGTISCDISVNNWSSQLKSKLLLLISKMDPRFHDMVLLVKEWAQNKNINDSVKQTFNSYCLTLLVLYHFQTCDPPILPPLESICSNNVVDVVPEEGVSKNAMKQILEECDKNIEIWRLNRFRRPVNRSSLSELFISFMNKFSNLWCWSNSKIDQICTYTTTREKIDRTSTNPIVALMVVDPFEEGCNVARTVVVKLLPTISEAFKSTHDLLTSPTRQLSRNELLAELSKNVKPYTISHFNNKSQCIPQQSGLPRESIDYCTHQGLVSWESNNKSQWIPQQSDRARLNYGSKDTKREIMYSEEEAETSSQTSRKSKRSSASKPMGISSLILAAGSLVLAGTALYSMSRDPRTKHDSDTDDEG